MRSKRLSRRGPLVMEFIPPDEAIRHPFTVHWLETFPHCRFPSACLTVFDAPEEALSCAAFLNSRPGVIAWVHALGVDYVLPHSTSKTL